MRFAGDDHPLDGCEKWRCSEQFHSTVQNQMSAGSVVPLPPPESLPEDVLKQRINAALALSRDPSTSPQTVARIVEWCFEMFAANIGFLQQHESSWRRLSDKMKQMRRNPNPRARHLARKYGWLTRGDRPPKRPCRVYELRPTPYRVYYAKSRCTNGCATTEVQ
jgi:hypothetical protein